MRHDFSPVRDAHRSLRHAAHWLRICPEFQVSDAYVGVMKAAEHSFALEHALMDKLHFPATRCHLEQHARVLRALHCLHPAVMGGASGTGRRVGGQLLVEWFQLHNETLDAAVFVWASYCGQSLMDELHQRRSFLGTVYSAGSASAFGNSTHN
ncbi:MAG: hypothetical protein RL404_1348 [Pseudomonadota bacterium]